VATNNESIRTQLIWEGHALQDVADHIFASGYIGAKKPDFAFFDAVERKLGLQPSRLMLIDDAAPNVAAAHAAGWKAHLYGDFAAMRLGSPVELDELLFA
jgi:putative hydrolase of the HAD superfamily